MEQVQIASELRIKTVPRRARAFEERSTKVEDAYAMENPHTERLWVTMRIIFGAVFLLDGMLKWLMFSQGVLGDAVLGMYFSSPAIASQSILLGVLVGLGETFGGLFLILGIFQRPAALWSAAIMLAIYVMGGFDSWYTGISGKVDLGGDLSLTLVFLLLALVVPLRYGLSSYLHLPERLAPKNTAVHRFVRALVA